MLEEITKLALVVLLPIFGVLNFERGADDGIPRWLFGVGIFISVFFIYLFASLKFSGDILAVLASFKAGLISSAKYAASLAAFGFWWSVWGWGRYFTAGHGDFRVWNYEHEEPIVDFIVDRIFGRNLRDLKEVQRAGIVAMNLRGWSFYPGFALVAYFSQSWIPAIIGLGMFAQGLFYHLGWRIWGITFIHPTEKVFGVYLGFLVALTGWFVL